MMLRRVPKVAVGLPVYNGGRYLAQALRSLTEQSYEDFELIISDNASTDDSQEICRHFADRDRRIRYDRLDANCGAANNFNRVFELSRSQYFRWAAHDDLCGPDYLRRCVETLDADPGVVLVHSHTGVINEQGERIPVYERPDEVAFGQRNAMPRWAIYDPPRKLDDPRPHIRLSELLLKTHWCFEIFGLTRSSVLQHTPLHLNFYGSDKVLLAHLCLAGRFVELDEELFLRRYHQGTSTNLADPAARERWMDPKKSSGPAAPHIELLVGYARAVMESPMKVGHRAACIAAVARYALQLRKLPSVMTNEVVPKTVQVIKQALGLRSVA
jgi:glycosyltransferase involved in cell wall biosynthesis